MNHLHPWLLAIPLLSAVTGWLINRLTLGLLFFPMKPVKVLGFTLQGLVPGRRLLFAAKLAGMGGEWFSFQEIENQVTHPDNLQKVMPQIETQVDHFLRVKLSASMPMISMFIGDKTINQLKGVFMEELRQLLPELLKNYVHTLRENLNIERLILEKITALPPEKMEYVLYKALSRELKPVQWLGAAIGFAAGLLQALILLIA